MFYYFYSANVNAEYFMAYNLSELQFWIDSATDILIAFLLILF